MKKVNNKKGFTLAELLVVLAILAVLVAIAVPLFTGAIGNARQTAIDANKRAIKSAALIQIMNDASLGDTGPWYASCTVDKDGSMGTVSVAKSGTESIPDDPAGSYVVEVTKVDITSAP